MNDPVADYMAAHFILVHDELHTPEEYDWALGESYRAWLALDDSQHADVRLRCSQVNAWSRAQRQRASSAAAG